MIRRNYCRHNDLCIEVKGPNTRVVDNDIIGDDAADPGTEDGIIVRGGKHALVVGNRLSHLGNGLWFDAGTGKYRDNLVTANVTTPFTGGTDAGNN